MRKLAAIMFTDIAGFTALSANDEAKALALIDRQREILKPIVEEYGGTWLKEMGDGLLLKFSSSHQALDCAIKIQETVKGVESLDLRIGIHQGDIIEQNEDVFGDDVNIASRIEPFAAIGGVAISDKVYRDISGNPEFEANYIGRPKLKGVMQEVGVYSIVSHGLPGTKLSEVVAKLERDPIPWKRYAIPVVLAIVGAFYLYLGNGGINSIAVLPFENQSGESEKDYIIAGMYNGLISELSQLSALRVISRRSAAMYGGSDKSLSEIARELNVDAVVEAVVLKAGDILNLRVELGTARPEEQNLWGQSFERDLTDALTLYGDIVRAIAEEINISLTPEEEARLSDT
ncbi:MAG: adenylate/guanylate cyclase domain-containing protein, partial [Candidatus Neomarinimicrobiota bacterium]